MDTAQVNDTCDGDLAHFMAHFEGLWAWHGEHSMKMGISKTAEEGGIGMNMKGDGKATENLIPMETIIVWPWILSRE